MNQENQLTEQNSEETEIDLLEIFYLLRAKQIGRASCRERV